MKKATSKVIPAVLPPASYFSVTRGVQIDFVHVAAMLDIWHISGGEPENSRAGENSISELIMLNAKVMVHLKCSE